MFCARTVPTVPQCVIPSFYVCCPADLLAYTLVGFTEERVLICFPFNDNWNYASMTTRLAHSEESLRHSTLVSERGGQNNETVRPVSCVADRVFGCTNKPSIAGQQPTTWIPGPIRPSVPSAWTHRSVDTSIGIGLSVAYHTRSIS